jgi:phosphoadenosine phosphosulfate reductase
MSINTQQTMLRQSGVNGMASSAARVLDVIDARPTYVQADADALNARFEGIDTLTMLRTLFAEDLLGEIAVVSSFGTESAVLLDLVARADSAIPVIFVDTLKMFPETLTYRETLIAALGIENAAIVRPDPAALAAKDKNELRWSFDPDGCCDIRKVEPLARAKQGLDAWISGRKAFQSVTRQNLPRFEVEDGRMKINPLGDWVKADLEAYFENRNLPRHPLESEGYLSVGCAPCTSKVKPGEDARAGRWRGWDKSECGIHSPVDPDDPANQPVF